jgi:hypothetical protein
MSAELLSLVIGVLLASSGIYSVVKRQCSVNLYLREEIIFGKSVAVPLFTLHGPRAVLYGSVSIVGSIVVLIPLILRSLHIGETAIRDDIVLIATLIGLFIAGLGFFTASLNEIANSLRTRAAQKTKKKKRGTEDSTELDEI